MTQPSFVPISEADQVRPSLQLEVPGHWTTDRPAELRIPARPIGRRMGTPGPDQGFALRLARRFEERLSLQAGESAEDIVVGCALVASRRSALFGRAPSVYDVRAALALWSFLAPAPDGLVEERRRAFQSVSHDYVVQRALVDRVPESTLGLSPQAVEAEVAAGRWAALVGAIGGPEQAVTAGSPPAQSPPAQSPPAQSLPA
ncbi:MAG TPA: hypothetical protein VHW47_09555 [Acidimicrobiales bacterium]|nr:hypothetical protein [Acidimicrobiales bacterium]